MRLATWNVNSVKARLPRLLDWLASAAPDVVCLQETKCPAEDFPATEVAALGYACAAHGDSRWNGVALLSRVGLDDVRLGLPAEPGFPTPDHLEARAIAATCGGVRLWSVYVPNGRAPDDPHYAYKLAWLAALRDAVGADLAGADAVGADLAGADLVGADLAGPDGAAGGGTPAALAVCGDFNVAPTDADVWDPAVFATSTHVTPAERHALAELRAAGLVDVVPRPLKGPNPFTYWDYRAGMFPKDMGMRIDLVYASSPVAHRVRDAYIDRQARKGKAPSDHAPVVVDLADLPGAD